MKKAAERASFLLVRDFGELENLQVSRKGFKNFVTIANLRSEELIIKELSKARPDFSFINEKSTSTAAASSNKWIIDPINGTMNFMRGIPQFAINIALMEKKEITAGITLDPIRSNYFNATLGGGAFVGNRNRLRVSNREEIKESVTATHVHSHIDNMLINNGSILRRSGTIALDLAYLAAGKYDVVIAHSAQLWDIASGMLIIKESGGFFEIEKNENNSYNIIAAASIKLLKQVQNIICLDNNSKLQ
jgi:myo-inositol-1(or 4)-monophosphatase